MKRSGWITGVVVLQLVYVLAVLALTVYLLVLTRMPRAGNPSDAAENISGLKVGVAILGIPALVALVAWLGLWKEKRWGWWLTILIDLAFFAAFGYSLIDDGWHNIDGALVTLTVIALVPAVCLLLPRVRRAYWRGRIPHLPPIGVESAAESALGASRTNL